jgi:hypothetical protein
MADITLSDGRELTFDLMQMSVAEYRRLFDVARECKTISLVLRQASKA